MARKFTPNVENAIAAAAQKYGIPESRLRAFVAIESGGNPGVTTGSYKGALQLSDREFSRYGGGNIYDPNDNINAGALKLKAEAEDFKRKYGRDPSDGDLYLIHQQGTGGAAAHWANPDQPAWKSMYSTGEGREKGPEWAKQAIWGNVPTPMRAKYGSVDNITSRDFVDLWNERVAHFGGNGSPSQPSGVYDPATGQLDALKPLAMVAGAGRESGPGAASPGGGGAPSTGSQPSAESGGILASLFGADSDGTPFKSLMSMQQAAAATAAPAPQPVQLQAMARPVDVSGLLAIVNRRNKLGSA